MTALEISELAVRLAAVALAALAVAGSARGAAAGSYADPAESSGMARRLRARTVYLIGAFPYFTCCVLLWREVGISFGAGARAALLAAGSILGAAGAFLYLEGRRRLGPMYNVSSALGSELYADQRLITDGLYRYVRHPMYLGLLVSAVGALLVFRTWTFVFVLVTFPLIVIKARREERLLGERFGASWDAYAARVPAWLPRRPTQKEVKHVDVA